MNDFGQTKGYLFYFLGIFIALFMVSCGPSTRPESLSGGITPTVPVDQPVEYGASLSEWEEATQAEPEQAGNGEAIAVQPENPTAPPTSVIVPTETALPAYPAASAEDSAPATGETLASTQYMIDDVAYREIMWDALVPEEFTVAAIMAKYEDQLAQIQDGSPEGFELYQQMQEEFNNAPVNETLDGTMVRLPGFIAPLEYTGDLITEFLLVPYFGACIHVPPPPANQTVLVRTAEGEGIKTEDSFYPVWIAGKMTTERASTELAEAGFYMGDAIIEPYTN